MNAFRDGILAEFHTANRAEAEKVTIFEYNKEEEDSKLREAEYEGDGKLKQAGEIRNGLLEKAGMKAGMIQMAREIQLEEDEIIKILCARLDVDEKTAKKMLEEQE